MKTNFGFVGIILWQVRKVKNRHINSARGLVILLLLAVPGFVSAQSTVSKADAAGALNKEGIRYFDAQQYEAAIESLSRAVLLQPNYATAYYNLGSAYFRLKNFEKAADAFQKAVKLDPNYAEAYNNLGAVYLEQGEVEKAVNVFNESIRLKAGIGDAISLYNLGCAYIRLGSFREAVRSLERAKQIDQNNVEIRFNLGYAYSREKRFRDAITEIEKAVSLDPRDEDSQLFLGSLYLAANAKESALMQYARLKTLNPQLAEKLYQAIYNGRILVVSFK